MQVKFFLVVLTTTFGLCVFAERATASQSSFLPSILEILLLRDSDEPVGLHPDAGKHIAKPLGTSTAPFGHYIYLPQNYTLDSGSKFPLLVFLHGLGEVGNGTTQLSRVLANGPPKMIQGGRHFPAIVVSPQVTIGSWQQQRNGFDIPSDLHALVTQLKRQHNVDADRVYFTGLSLGGGGVWNYARLYSDEVAAIVPICGVGTNGQMISDLANIGVWAFHSIGDNIVNSRETIRQMNLIGGTTLDGEDGVMAAYPGDGDDHVVSRVDNQWVWNAGRYDATGDTRFTLFPDASHNSWSRAYNQGGAPDTPLWTWLFAQTRNSD